VCGWSYPLYVPTAGCLYFENSQLDEGMENDMSNAGIQLPISNVSLAAPFFSGVAGGAMDVVVKSELSSQVITSLSVEKNTRGKQN